MNQKQAKRLSRDARAIVPEKNHPTNYNYEYYHKVRWGGMVGAGTITVAPDCLRGVYRAFKKGLRSGQTI